MPSVPVSRTRGRLAGTLLIALIVATGTQLGLPSVSPAWSSPALHEIALDSSAAVSVQARWLQPVDGPVVAAPPAQPAPPDVAVDPYVIQPPALDFEPSAYRISA